MTLRIVTRSSLGPLHRFKFAFDVQQNRTLSGLVGRSIRAMTQGSYVQRLVSGMPHSVRPALQQASADLPPRKSGHLRSPCGGDSADERIVLPAIDGSEVQNEPGFFDSPKHRR